MVNIFAITKPGTDFPAYISINRDEHTGQHTITVRSQGHGGTHCGTTDVSPEELEQLCAALSEYLYKDN